MSLLLTEFGTNSIDILDRLSIGEDVVFCDSNILITRAKRNYHLYLIFYLSSEYNNLKHEFADKKFNEFLTPYQIVLCSLLEYNVSLHNYSTKVSPDIANKGFLFYYRLTCAKKQRNVNQEIIDKLLIVANRLSEIVSEMKQLSLQGKVESIYDIDFTIK